MIRSNKLVIPFALVLAAAVLAASVVIIKSHRQAQNSSRTESSSTFIAPRADKRTPAPELHVLSTAIIGEVMFAGGGQKQADVKILSPPDSQYTQAVAKPGKQGVSQLSMKFEADGSISEIVPLVERSLCSICLLPDDEAKAISQDLPKTRKRDGIEVIGIDPTAPQSRELVGAAVAAVKQISFTPSQSGGKPVSTHGLVECVFRLD